MIDYGMMTPQLHDELILKSWDDRKYWTSK
jgi:hypothetical protein